MFFEAVLNGSKRVVGEAKALGRVVFFGYFFWAPKKSDPPLAEQEGPEGKSSRAAGPKKHS